MSGNDELKSLDEKGSDGGEGSSPGYRDHDDHHHPFNEGSEELEDGDLPAAQPSTSDVKSMEEVPSDIQTDKVVEGKEDNGVLIQRDMKFEESSESKDASFEHIEIAKESYYGNENTSGPSNDESVTEKKSKDEDYNSTQEAIAYHELVKSIDSSPSKMTLIAENAPVKETGNSADESSVNSVTAVASVSEVEKDDTRSVLLEKSIVPSLGVTDLAMKINEDNVYPLGDETATTSSLEEPKPKECDGKVLASLSAGPFAKANNGAEHIKNSETRERSENQVLHFLMHTSFVTQLGFVKFLSKIHSKFNFIF